MLQQTQEIPQLPQRVSQPSQGLPQPKSGEYTPKITEDGMLLLHSLYAS